MKTSKEEKIYVGNMDCADCARKFAQRVAQLPGVDKAEVNFAAATLSVWGQVDMAAIQELADLEDYTLSREIPKVGRQSPWKSKQLNIVLAAGALLVCGMICHWSFTNQIAANLLFAAAMLVGGYRTFHQAYHNVRALKFDISVLMTIAVIGSLLMGEFHEAAMVAWLFSLANWLEKYTASAARNSLAQLFENIPRTAVLLTPAGEKEVPAETVEPGQLVLVKAGEKIPVDGMVTDGRSEVNEAAISGDAMPVAKEAGSQVLAGTVNLLSCLTIQTEKKAQDSSMAQIAALVEAAHGKEGARQNLINRFAAKFTPVVIVLAVLIALVPPLFLGDWRLWFENALAVLVVACPCALVIATPAVMVPALGNAARHGVIIKGSNEMERLATASLIALNKTGTLTQGTYQVAGAMAATGRQQDLLPLAASVMTHSNQPIAQAIRGLCANPPASSDCRLLAGIGTQAKVNGKTVLVGRTSQALPPETLQQVNAWEGQGMTVVSVMEEGQLIGLIALQDPLRPEAVAVMAQLKDLDIPQQVMLTSDAAASAAGVAQQLGLTGYYAGLSPEQELEQAMALKEQGGVLVAGGDLRREDGAALSGQDVAAAAGGSSSDIALAASDVTLTAGDLTKLPYAVELSRRAMRVIRQNILLAVGLKAIAFVLIFPGWLTLWIAILSDMGANILVTLNGMRLTR